MAEISKRPVDGAEKAEDDAGKPEAVDPKKTIPYVIDPANMGFIRYIIKFLLPIQPKWVQAVILFVFVALFTYIVAFTMQASIVLPVTVQVALTHAEVIQKQQEGIFVEPNSFKAPPPGYVILHNYFGYALNSDGEARIDLSISTFATTVVFRQLSVTVKAPDKTTYPRTIELSGIASGSLFFKPSNVPEQGQGFGAAEPSWREASIDDRHVKDNPLLFAAANAESIRGGRLYLQTITLPPTQTVSSVGASLSVGNANTKLVALSNDLASQDEAELPVKGGATVVQDFRAFFSLPQAQAPKPATIKLQSSVNFLGLGYSETFSLPDEVNLGESVTIKGSAGGTIAVQLTYPIDVVLFERRDTSATTQLLVRKINAAGYASRVNANAVASGGTYNTIYGGADVPISSLRDMIRIAADAHVEIRYIHPQAKLSNGLQNQIQIGSNANVACLASIGGPALTALSQSSTDAEFLELVGDLPKPGSCKS